MSVFKKSMLLGLLLLVFCVSQTYAQTNNSYLLRTIIDKNGKQVDEVIVPGRPPKNYRAPVAYIPPPGTNKAVITLSKVPAFDWCYGCSATSAAMMAGYYDNNNYPNMYTGPTNGGVVPLNNSNWGQGECPLSATHMGFDGLATRGHVDDYWIAYDDPGPDPYIINAWTEHTHADCTADFMGTNQSAKSNSDGGTLFYYYTNGAPLYDYTGCEPDQRDGCHGMRLFFESRGYTVTNNYSQYIYGYNGNTQGITFDQYKAEIDAGRPVLIQVMGHTMLGFGYDDSNNLVYLHDTWDHSAHTMTWGGEYSGMTHYAATLVQLAPPTPPTSPVSLAANFMNSGLQVFSWADFPTARSSQNPSGKPDQHRRVMSTPAKALPGFTPRQVRISNTANSMPLLRPAGLPPDKSAWLYPRLGEHP